MSVQERDFVLKGVGTWKYRFDNLIFDWVSFIATTKKTFHLSAALLCGHRSVPVIPEHPHCPSQEQKAIYVGVKAYHSESRCVSS